MTPTAAMDAVAAQIVALTPKDKANSMDVFARFQGIEDEEGHGNRDRTFNVVLLAGPGERNDRIHSPERTMNLGIVVSYSHGLTIYDRIAEDNEQISEKIDDFVNNISGVTDVERLALPIVTTDERGILVEHGFFLSYSKDL